jgi:hypothetical protein
MRTTLDIDTPVLSELKKLGRQQHKSLGRVVSDIVARGLSSDRSKHDASRSFSWIDKPMGMKVDISDSEALYHAMERERSP